MFTATDWIRDKNGLMVLTPFPIKWAGKAAKQVYHKLRQKDTGNEAASRTFLQRKGFPSYNLSVIADAMPPLLVGEALAVPAK